MKYQNKNETFFKEPNRVNSYWAGFIAADGSVSAKVLEITLSTKDRKHLEALSTQLNKDYVVKERLSGQTSYSPGTPYVKMEFSSKQTVEHLRENFNITRRKTFTLEFPNHLTVEHKKAFVCGYIDGDGHIGLRKGHGGKLQMSICGNEGFLTDLISFLREDGGVDIKNNLYPSRRIHAFLCSGRTALGVLGFLYGDDLPVMSRKWDVYRRHKDHKFGQYLEWTEQELQLIRDLYPTHSVRKIWELHFKESRSFASVEKIISNRLGLKKFPTQIKWTQEEDNLLRELRLCGKMSVKEIHEKHFPQRTLSSVRNRAKRFSQNKRG